MNTRTSALESPRPHLLPPLLVPPSSANTPAATFSTLLTPTLFWLSTWMARPTLLFACATVFPVFHTARGAPGRCYIRRIQALGRTHTAGMRIRGMMWVIKRQCWAGRIRGVTLRWLRRHLRETAMMTSGELGVRWGCCRRCCWSWGSCSFAKGLKVVYHCISNSRAYIKTFCPFRRMLKTRFGEVTDRLGRVQFL